ncbi:RIP metalloprotease RseP [Dongia sedimenti]|uniref:Zinc metalloprotease n=1 Tax=Dongia sedimenti TaxID=3064282 RepID=A0ABU0YK18_9PROT|nr:RIP metalloprotease RseP [Rhodospirillaceae bacterium R-7]
MEILNQIQHYGFWFLVVLTVLVFIHELGHFAVARWCKVRVEVFSIGFGPELFGWTDRTGTRWKFSWLPLGGYVRMFGQDENVIEGEAARPMTDAERSVSFKHKTVGQRMAIVFAGPAANYILAFAIFTALYAIGGKQVIPPVIGKVFAESPAARAGIAPGDTVVKVDGTEIESFFDIQYVVQSSLGKMLTIDLTRNGAPVRVQVQPGEVTTKDASGKETTFVGLGFGLAEDVKSVTKNLSLGESVVVAGSDIYRGTVGTLKGLWQMVTGLRSTDEIGGVLRIAKMSGDVAQVSLVSLIAFAGALSINLGLINLFPVPMLDGGHLVYYAVEAVRGKPLGERAQEFGLKVGLALVLSLMLFATWNDLVYLKVVDFVKSLFT